MLKRLKSDLYACGREGLPKEITIKNHRYQHVRTFKHDFFAATGYYEPTLNASPNSIGTLRPVVLKINRIQPFCKIPLSWLGRFLTRREMYILRQLEDLDQVPQLAGSWGKNGFAYLYIDGRSLDEKPSIPDNFFEELEELLGRIHQRHICYIDLNKRGNILVGADGRPYLIDFQISMTWNRSGRICRRFQKEDHYHLLKHKRRLRPDLLSPSQREESYRRSIWIQIHRILAKPFRFLRRGIMRWLYKHGYLMDSADLTSSPENNPNRFRQ